MELKKEFLPGEIESFQPNEKVGLLATVNPLGLPHVSLITSLLAVDETHMAFGEFSVGLSKSHARGNSHSGVAACAGCHGPDAHGTETLPRLAGQQSLYIEGQLKAFDKRERNNDNEVMHAIASKLTELEIKALAEYLASTP